MWTFKVFTIFFVKKLKTLVILKTHYYSPGGACKLFKRVNIPKTGGCAQFLPRSRVASL